MRWPPSEPPEPRRTNPAAQAIGQFMRDRREALGLSVRDLAHALGVSEPYIYLLETGRKELHYAMAQQMAQVLRIDEALLVDWVKEHRPRSYLSALEHRAEGGTKEREPRRLVRRPRRRDEESGFAQRAERPLDSAAEYLARFGRMREPQPRPAGERGLLQIPLFEAGRPPHEDEGAAAYLPFERRLIAPDEDPDALFAYTVDWRMARRVPDVLAEGDTVILTREAWPLRPRAVYAVNMSGVIELARVSMPRDVLIVEDGPDQRHQGVRIALEDVVQGDRLHPASRLVGRVVATVRRYR